jgi:hypothetical protein
MAKRVLRRRLRLTDQFLDSIRKEEKRRIRRAVKLDNEGHEWALDVFEEERPYLNELCLMLLVTLWHEVEREIVSFGARVVPEGGVLQGAVYRERLIEEREQFRLAKTRKVTIKKLGLDECSAWGHEMEALRQVVNCYKHSPSQRPDQRLLEHLHLPLKPEPRVVYASLMESNHFRKGLAKYLDLDENAGYPEIAGEFVSRVNTFLNAVEKQPEIASVKWGAISLTTFEG